MEHFVNLDHLPQELEFPPELRTRIRYDSQRKSLVFHGPMSKATYDALLKLHDNGEYRRALEKLFCQATYAAETSEHGQGAIVCALVVIVLVVAVAAVVIWYVARAT